MLSKSQTAGISLSMIITPCLKLYQCTKEYQIVSEITVGTDDSKQQSVVLVCAAVSQTAANVTGVYSTQCQHEPRYR